MTTYGIPTKIINIIKEIYTEAQCTIKTEQSFTSKFNILTGVRQGCVLSPFLFNLAMNFVLKNTQELNSGIDWGNSILSDLDFADDICLLHNKTEEMQKSTTALYTTSQKLGLYINKNKTMIMKNDRLHDDTHIDIQGIIFKEVDNFCYLGSTISKDGDCRHDIDRRIILARLAFKSLNNLWRQTNISIKTKLRIFTTNVLSVLSYGAETWKSNKSIEKRLNTFQNHCLRNILKIKCSEHVTNEELLKRAKTKPLSSIIKRRRLTFLGHVLRKISNNIGKQTFNFLLKNNIQGKRKQGRPKDIYKKTILKELQNKWNNVENIAQNRSLWKKLTNALCA